MSAIDNKKIAKNTVALYIRMGICIVVSLYTSRVVINALGVSDYGLYNLVGGIVGVLGFLNASMAGATSRFLTYEQENGSEQKLRLTFSGAMIIHLCIAGFLFLIAETIGLWFLNNKVSIDPSRMVAANIVYQVSIISSVLGILQVPYNACLIAHEKFTFYAYVEIFSAICKLSIAFAIFLIPGFKLIVFSILNLLVCFGFLLIYNIYCIKNYRECRVLWRIDKSVIKPMLSFSGWDFYGNMSVTINFQGFGIVMNLFYGTVINAAYGIANTVQGTLKGLALNVIMASRPQIIKRYALGEIDMMEKLVFNASRMSLVLYLCLAMPLYIEADYVLKLWLGVVPDYTVSLLRIVLISTLFNLANNVLNIIIHATAKMKVFSFVTGTLYLLAPFILYVLLRNGIPIEKSFYICVLSYLLASVATIGFVKRYIKEFRVLNLISTVYLPILPFISVFMTLCYMVNLQQDFYSLLIACLSSCILSMTFAWFYCLDKNMRCQLKNRFKRCVFSKL